MAFTRRGQRAREEPLAAEHRPPSGPRASGSVENGRPAPNDRGPAEQERDFVPPSLFESPARSPAAPIVTPARDMPDERRSAPFVGATADACPQPTCAPENAPLGRHPPRPMTRRGAAGLETRTGARPPFTVRDRSAADLLRGGEHVAELCGSEAVRAGPAPEWVPTTEQPSELSPSVSSGVRCRGRGATRPMRAGSGTQSRPRRASRTSAVGEVVRPYEEGD